MTIGRRAWPLGLIVAGCYLGCSGGEAGPPGGNTSLTSTTATPTTTSTGSGTAGTTSDSAASVTSGSTSSVGGSGTTTTTTTTTTASTTTSLNSTVSGSSGGSGGSGPTATNGSTNTTMAAGGTTGAGGTGATTTTGDASTTGGSDVSAQPSAGCGNGNPSPSLNLPNNTIVHLPPSYDGSTPVPLVMLFHAAGNPNTQLQGIYEGDLGDKYMMLYPKSAGNEWNDNTDGGVVDALFSQVTSNACVDENRVFAVGHSSGAQFVVQRLCAGETRWRAVAPVASSKYCNSWDPVPALVIHGIGDQERSWDPNGEEDIVPYRTSNSCMESSTPYPVDGCQSGSTQVDPGCVQFDGCSEVTIWCQHNDPQYGTSHHGVPCFGPSLTREFFDSF